MTKISVWVQSDKGRFHPGTAVVRIDGEIYAKLLGEEGFEIEVHPPQFSTTIKRPPVELSGAAAERAEEILDRRTPDWRCEDDHALADRPDDVPSAEPLFAAAYERRVEQPPRPSATSPRRRHRFHGFPIRSDVDYADPYYDARRGEP